MDEGIPRLEGGCKAQMRFGNLHQLWFRRLLSKNLLRDEYMGRQIAGPVQRRKMIEQLNCLGLPPRHGQADRKSEFIAGITGMILQQSLIADGGQWEVVRGYGAFRFAFVPGNILLR